MSKLQWSEFSLMIDWLQKYQQENGNIFRTKDFRAAFNLDNLPSSARLKRLVKFDLIKPANFGHYEILEITPQKIQEAKKNYVFPGATNELHNWGGQQLTLKEIHARFRSPVSLEVFSRRIARGWTIKRALSEPLQTKGN